MEDMMYHFYYKCTESAMGISVIHLFNSFYIAISFCMPSTAIICVQLYCYAAFK